MKLTIAKVLLISTVGFCAQRASAQPFSIDRFVIAGGGGTSTGGPYAMNGTLGQHEASPQPLSAGSFSLAGGFWGVIQTPPSVPTVIEVWVINGEVHLRFNGIPGQVYEIERASFVAGPWRPNGQPLAVITMPIGGVVEFVDTTSPALSQSFYRTSTR